MTLLRVVVVGGLFVVLAGTSQAEPKASALRRKWAPYLDPAAPKDPPVPWASLPAWLDVVFLIERSAANDGAKLEAAKATAREIHDALEEWDMAAILAFDTSVEMVLPAQGHVKERKAFKKALASVTARGGSDVVAALDEAREYIAAAHDRKVIVLFMDLQAADAKLGDAIRAASREHITVVVVALPGADHDAVWELGGIVRTYSLDRRGAASTIAQRIAELHDRW